MIAGREWGVHLEQGLITRRTLGALEGSILNHHHPSVCSVGHCPRPQFYPLISSRSPHSLSHPVYFLSPYFAPPVPSLNCGPLPFQSFPCFCRAVLSPLLSTSSYNLMFCTYLCLLFVHLPAPLAPNPLDERDHTRTHVGLSLRARQYGGNLSTRPGSGSGSGRGRGGGHS